MKKSEISNKGGYSVVSHKQQRIAAFYGHMRHEHAQSFVMMQEGRVQLEAGIKPLVWGDPITYTAGEAPYYPDFGGQEWIARTPWDYDYEINSFDKPDMTVYKVTFGAVLILENARCLTEVKDAAQLDHERRIKECLE